MVYTIADTHADANEENKLRILIQKCDKEQIKKPQDLTGLYGT